jgi:regulator of sirC expression with transglutaminase-like and TPR domain
MGQTPLYCRPAAFDAFLAQLPSLEETDSLVRAAVAVAMHKLDDCELDSVDATLDQLAVEIRGRVSSGNENALVAQLHQVLFDEYGFTGNVDDYYNPENSYLPCVLRSRRGIPVTLALVYKSVAQRLGLAVRGINSPAHFLAAVEVDGSWMTIDPFERGLVLSRDEVFDRLEKLAGTSLDRSDDLLATATHGQWLARIIRNLEQVFTRRDQINDALAMREFLGLVPE